MDGSSDKSNHIWRINAHFKKAGSAPQGIFAQSIDFEIAQRDESPPCKKGALLFTPEWPIDSEKGRMSIHVLENDGQKNKALDKYFADENKVEQWDKRYKSKRAGKQIIIINFVWLGNSVFGPLEKFNLYSWRALGHTVNIYSYPFAGVDHHTLDSLGLEQGDAKVIQLKDILTEDDNAEGNDNPKMSLSDARSVLKRWLGDIPKEVPPKRDHIFNMVDLTKSYIGGTRQGIVLDVKVGPSVHLQAYAESFRKYLISYTRGGNTAEVPENQCIGTMQESETLRLAYAQAFNAKIKGQKYRPGLLDAKATESWFNALTSFHGQSYKKTGEGLDVATMSPTGEGDVDNPVKGYSVSEPGPRGQGPFRVFKRATDQTNKAGLKTKPEEVKRLAAEVYTELVESGGNSDFLQKVFTAQKAMP